MSDNIINENSNMHGYVTLADICDSFCADFFDDDQCRKWILNKLHPAGPSCPACRQILLEKYHKRFWQNERLRCPLCEKWFTALTGTMFHGMHMKFSELILLAIFLGLNQPLKIVAQYLNVDPETVRQWRRKMNKNWRCNLNIASGSDA